MFSALIHVSSSAQKRFLKAGRDAIFPVPWCQVRKSLRLHTSSKTLYVQHSHFSTHHGHLSVPYDFLHTNGPVIHLDTVRVASITNTAKERNSECPLRQWPWHTFSPLGFIKSISINSFIPLTKPTNSEKNHIHTTIIQGYVASESEKTRNKLLIH